MDDDWDSILLNPFEEAIQKGKREGRNDGLKAGYNDGYHLGKVKALEIGVELGYMRAISVSILDDLLSISANENSQCTPVENKNNREMSQNSFEKIQKRIQRIQDFLKQIEFFPSPDDLFCSSNQDHKVESSSNDDEDKSQDMNQNEVEPVSSSIDIAQKMQRLRAKFKTILVQSKLPNFTLKKVMNENISKPSSAMSEMSLSEKATEGNKVTMRNENNSVHDNEW
ncbi:hypothetical protein CTEN210_08451 [Chaetoceros tenuissimus]|uniref:Essential protein Yae1 N-terminal domain-containing protein n=1 Tax=Chaetoceros tenuissimus TaxID=426638 RepID=A0AAD3CW06_9STRA|nr:hypothetical protein CTEN210_08451 [Chaetoceros tenuissimus]